MAELAWSRSALGELNAPGEGQTEAGAFGLTLLPKVTVDVQVRLEGLGRLIDAMAVAQGPTASPTLIAATDKRGEAIKACRRATSAPPSLGSTKRLSC